ncbi:hypothetical protein Tdes44962_MAKER08642 [Teratosphaeria destructans]|uniref:Uncharacterized protein n=1 Tax=Teratosphaeria destructans TaxID=418781 RepID=A0A9W7W4P1_9PEZI|nr:hypothetical protein Tdes44962_MAKER08642 [Teratosphaeria destructans]
MADARSLLREERARRDKEAAARQGNKKRKADSIDSPKVAAERKKSRPEQQHAREVANDERLLEAELNPRHIVPREGLITAEQVQMGTKALEHSDKLDHLTPPGSPDHGAATKPAPPEADIDASEMAAFEAELIAMDAQNRRTNTNIAAAAQATISAKPMTAAEVAAKAREEQSRQKGLEEEEAEDDKADAARMLEEEFEEMEGLEERVRVLRERREALRKGSSERADSKSMLDGAESKADAAQAEEEDEDEEDEDEEDDFFARR